MKYGPAELYSQHWSVPAPLCIAGQRYDPNVQEQAKNSVGLTNRLHWDRMVYSARRRNRLSRPRERLCYTHVQKQDDQQQGYRLT